MGWGCCTRCEQSGRRRGEGRGGRDERGRDGESALQAADEVVAGGSDACGRVGKQRGTTGGECQVATEESITGLAIGVESVVVEWQCGAIGQVEGEREVGKWRSVEADKGGDRDGSGGSKRIRQGKRDELQRCRSGDGELWRGVEGAGVPEAGLWCVEIGKGGGGPGGGESVAGASGREE